MLATRRSLIAAVSLIALLIVSPAEARRRSVLPPQPPLVEQYAEGGYAGVPSVAQGGTIDFHIATSVSPFDVTLANLSSSSTVLTRIQGLTSRAQNCNGAYAGGCNWPTTTTFSVPLFWPSGYYKASFPTSLGTRNIVFIVRAAQPGTSSKIVVVSPTHTYQAYNHFGGGTLYLPTGDSEKPAPVVASRLSYNRPYETGAGLGLYDGWEHQFAEWMEKERRPFEVITDIDLEDSTILSHYNVVVLVGHSEYWTSTARTKLETFSRSGGHIAIFGAATMWWQVRLEDENRTLVAYRDPTADPLYGRNNQAVAFQWSGDPVNRPENTITGASYRNGGFANKVADPKSYSLVPPDQRTGLAVTDPSSWVFAGAGVSRGSTFGKLALGLDTDGALFNCGINGDILGPDGSDGTPANYHILAVAPASNGRATMGIYVNPSGSAVFNAATLNWVYGLETDPVVQAVTRNVLSVFQNGSRLMYDPVETPILTQELFNCPQDSPKSLPGWASGPTPAKLTSACAYEGPAGLELSGPDPMIFSRPFAATGQPRQDAEVRFYVRADQLANRGSNPMGIVGLRQRSGTSSTTVAQVEFFVASNGTKQVRVARRNSAGEFFASPFTTLSDGWHLIEMSWHSAGAVSIQIDGGTTLSVDNADPTQGVTELLVNYQADANGRGTACLDAIAVGSSKLGSVPGLR